MSLFNFIKQQVPILDVISESVNLKPAGNYWKGSCIFHAEKDASFTVSPEKQIYYCFGCHASGDVISFIAKLEHLNQLEAAQLLVDRFQLTVPTEFTKQMHSSTAEEKDAKDRYFQTCKAFSAWAHKQLFSHQFAVDYLLQRSITLETIKAFEVGYFPGGQHMVARLQKDLQAEGFLLKDLYEAGVFSEGKGAPYSPFEERIVFPIKDTQGRHCGFGGRVFRTGDDRAKYYNSKEADGFEKGKILFGFTAAKKAIQAEESVFLVEGYVDCIMMAQYGFTNVVATLGTACTLDHLKQLSRHAHTLYVLYDGDQAGQKAMLRLAELCWEVNLEMYVITLPAKHDPASFLIDGGDLLAYKNNATEIMHHFISSLGGHFLTKPLAQKMTSAEKIVATIAKINNSFKQDVLLHHAASVMQMPFDSLKTLLGTISRKQSQKIQFENKDLVVPVAAEPAESEEPDNQLLEEKIFSGILGGIAAGKLLHVPNDVRPYFSSRMQSLLQLVEQWHSHHDGSSSVSELLASFEAIHKDWVVRVAMQHNTQTCLELFDRLLDRFCKVHWQRIVKDIKQQLVKAKQENDTQTMNDVLERFSHLKQGMMQRGLVR
jgi:DNA primase catalytic core